MKIHTNKKTEQKMYVVRKYIMADSVAQALRKDNKTKPHEVFVDDEWKKGQSNSLASAIGFEITNSNQ